MQRHIRQVRRQFEALRPKRQIVYGEPDGHDLDLWPSFATSPTGAPAAPEPSASW